MEKDNFGPLELQNEINDFLSKARDRYHAANPHSEVTIKWSYTCKLRKVKPKPTDGGMFAALESEARHD